MTCHTSVSLHKVIEQESTNTERLSCPSCGGSHSGQSSKLKPMMSTRMMINMNWAFIRYVCLTKACPITMGTL